MSAQDPYSWYSGGTIALSNTSGGDLYRYVVYDSGTPGGSGKAVGLGDLEALCDPAPIEIGNRVWLDTDRDGIQDAGEGGLSGIAVQLYQGLTLVTTVTTDANGNYKFTGLLPNTAYTISLALGQAALGSKPLSTNNVGTNDLIDSDMSKVGNTGVIFLTTGYYGENNHTFDIGFEPNCNASVTVAGSNNCVGATATLTGTGNTSGGFYAWSGPNSYTSFSQNPTISNAQLTHAGAYSVTFTAPNGCTATGSAQLNVNPVVSITSQPTAFAECIGGTQTISVAATGGFAPLTYQWYNSTDGGTTWTLLSGATAATYLPLSTAAGTTLYRVVVASTGGTGCNPATSTNTSVTIAADPVVTISTLPTTVCIGANLTLTANPTGGAGTCTIQWQSSPDGTTWTAISGAIGTTYNVVSASATKRYRALMSCTGNGCCN